ncbi:MAG: aminopeptidase P N-terminal domain-containing protein [Turicibacter sp.]|nr:aminopeptidase P N-terminal domain-containing protein [Turicibacter sp.]
MLETLKVRRQKLAGNIKDNSLLILFSGEAPVRSGDQFYEYTPHRNFYYLTNLDSPKMVYVLRKVNGVMEDYLFIETVSEVEEKWTGKRMSKEEATAISGIKNVFSESELRQTLGRWLLNERFENAYFDFERGSYTHADTVQILFAKELKRQYPFLHVQNIYQDITALRLIKSEDEIKNMRTAIEKTRLGIEGLMKNAKPGLYEYQLEAHYDFIIKTEGVKRTSFHTIAASGANATVLHYDKNNSVCQDGDLILFDLGCEWNYYCSDISRTFPINGKFSDRQRDVYQAVLDAQLATIEIIKPGISLQDVNEFARKKLAEGCKKLGLIETDEELSNYYYHGIGHYLGLDTHDVGGRGGILQPGMVITIEPGLYIAEEGIGIRIEDDILVTADGHENLSKDIIKSVEEIEAFMAAR